MAVNNAEGRHSDSQIVYRGSGGWTKTHSWVFIAIIAVGLAVIVFQNRYHYLDPQGLGRAYRISKFFGSIQEFDPDRGWIAARLQAPPPQASMMTPPPNMAGVPPTLQPHGAGQPPEPDAGPPEQTPQSFPPPTPAPATAPEETPMVGEPSQQPAELPFSEKPDGQEIGMKEEEIVSEQPAPPPPREMSREERLDMFLGRFPDYGEDEFQLAHEDLYPDWKKRMGADGQWPKFIDVYQEFIDWWIDAGSPPKPGFQLWEEFMASKEANR